MLLFANGIHRVADMPHDVEAVEDDLRSRIGHLRPRRLDVGLPHVHSDILRLDEGFGFESRQGGSHLIFFHPVHRHLRATIARHRSLAVGYVQTAISLIEALKALESKQEKP